MTNSDYRNEITGLEKMYNERLEEYQKAKDISNRLEATKQVNIEEFKKQYSELDETIIKIYGLEIPKDIETLTLGELLEIKEKLDNTFRDISKKIESYLRTGKVEDLGNLITLTEQDRSQQETQQRIQQEEENNIQEQQEINNDSGHYSDGEVDLSVFTQ